LLCGLAHPCTLPPCSTRRSSDLRRRTAAVDRACGGSRLSSASSGGEAAVDMEPSDSAALLTRCGTELAGRPAFGRCEDPGVASRSEEHTSELQSRENLVCRLLLE